MLCSLSLSSPIISVRTELIGKALVNIYTSRKRHYVNGEEENCKNRDKKAMKKG